MFENRPQLDRLVDVLEFVDALRQALGEGPFERLDHDPPICLRDRFSLKQQVIDLPVDEIAVTLEVLLVDIKPGRDPEESLEFSYAHDVAGWSSVRLHRGDHNAMLPCVSRAPIDDCQNLSIFFSRFSPWC